MKQAKRIDKKLEMLVAKAKDLETSIYKINDDSYDKKLVLAAIYLAIQNLRQAQDICEA